MPVGHAPFVVRDVEPRLQRHDHPGLQHLVLALRGAVVRVHAQPVACRIPLISLLRSDIEMKDTHTVEDRCGPSSATLVPYPCPNATPSDALLRNAVIKTRTSLQQAVSLAWCVGVNIDG